MKMSQSLKMARQRKQTTPRRRKTRKAHPSKRRPRKKTYKKTYKKKKSTLKRRMRKQHGGWGYEPDGLSAMAPWMSLTKAMTKYVAKNRTR